ncbi:MAG TPA: GUN4 domain-containing protein [Trichocoleus sp.]|jgi:hypothetical protein
MTDINTYLKVLELEPGASEAEIKQAYRDLVFVWHPDRFVDHPRLQKKAQEKLKQLNIAYEFLQASLPETATVSSSKGSVYHKTSVAGVDLNHLEELLHLNRWKEADLETKMLLLKVSGREKEGWLRPEDVKKLSLDVLGAIDLLWLNYSNERFGFSVQKTIWQAVSLKSDRIMDIRTRSELRFGIAVGWYVNNAWLLQWDNFGYDIQAPRGNLPRQYIFILPGWWRYSRGLGGYLLWEFEQLLLKL